MTRLVPVNCKTCSGTGRVEFETPYARLSDGTAWVFRNCPECEGRGSFEIEMDEADADMEAEHGVRASRGQLNYENRNEAIERHHNYRRRDGMIRQPTPVAELYAWHTAITAGWHPLTPVGEPQVGWFKRRLIKNGIYVPARIWLEQEIDETTGELVADERLLCEVAGERRDPLDEWTWLCGHPISKAEFDYMAATMAWAAWHAPNAPEANPKRPLNPLRTPIRF